MNDFEKRTPLNDLDIEDASLLTNYKAKMGLSKYGEAVQILNEVEFEKGIRASTLNAIKKSILELEVFILNLTADKDTLYSVEQPTLEQMQDKIYWIQPKL